MFVFLAYMSIAQNFHINLSFFLLKPPFEKLVICSWYGYLFMVWVYVHGMGICSCMGICSWHGYLFMVWVFVHGMGIYSWYGYLFMVWVYNSWYEHCSRCWPLLLGYHTVLTLPVGSTGITIQNKNGYCHMGKYTNKPEILVEYRLIIKFSDILYIIVFLLMWYYQKQIKF